VIMSIRMYGKPHTGHALDDHQPRSNTNNECENGISHFIPVGLHEYKKRS
jgi:hypothetical protein